jgi:chromosome segregation ATPase
MKTLHTEKENWERGGGYVRYMEERLCEHVDALAKRVAQLERLNTIMQKDAADTDSGVRALAKRVSDCELSIHHHDMQARLDTLEVGHEGDWDRINALAKRVKEIQEQEDTLRADIEKYGELCKAENAALAKRVAAIKDDLENVVRKFDERILLLEGGAVIPGNLSLSRRSKGWQERPSVSMGDLGKSLGLLVGDVKLERACDYLRKKGIGVS